LRDNRLRNDVRVIIRLGAVVAKNVSKCRVKVYLIGTIVQLLRIIDICRSGHMADEIFSHIVLCIFKVIHHARQFSH